LAGYNHIISPFSAKSHEHDNWWPGRVTWELVRWWVPALRWRRKRQCQSGPPQQKAATICANWRFNGILMGIQLDIKPTTIKCCMRYYDIPRFGDGPESIESGFIYPVYAIPKIVVGNSDTIKFPV
jgi:hypothetical protein